jgi:hypothetical protein
MSTEMGWYLGTVRLVWLNSSSESLVSFYMGRMSLKVKVLNPCMV